MKILNNAINNSLPHHLLEKKFVLVNAYYGSSDIGALLYKSQNIEHLQNKKHRAYTFKAELALDVHIGDIVLVETRGETELVQVCEVFEDLSMLEDGIDYKWVIDKIDFSALYARKQEKEDIEKALRLLEQQKMKDELKQSFIHASADNQELHDLTQKLKTNHDWL